MPPYRRPSIGTIVTPWGWFLMIGVWVLTLGVNAWCLIQLLKEDRGKPSARAKS
jgi:hypothetical protein